MIFPSFSDNDSKAKKPDTKLANAQDGSVPHKSVSKAAKPKHIAHDGKRKEKKIDNLSEKIQKQKEAAENFGESKSTCNSHLRVSFFRTL